MEAQSRNARPETTEEASDSIEENYFMSAMKCFATFHPLHIRFNDGIMPRGCVHWKLKECFRATEKAIIAALGSIAYEQGKSNTEEGALMKAIGEVAELIVGDTGDSAPICGGTRPGEGLR